MTLEEFYKSLDIIVHSKYFWYCASFSLVGIPFLFPFFKRFFQFLVDFFFEEVDEETEEQNQNIDYFNDLD